MFNQFRSRKLPAPAFQTTPPYNPSTGKRAGIENQEYEWPRIVLARVVAEFDDYIICNCYTEEQLASAQPGRFEKHPAPFEGRYFAVAKPYLLQRTPWDGQEVTYPGFASLDGDGAITVVYSYTDIGLRQAHDADGVEYDERQRITPDYFVNDIICIARGRGAWQGDYTGITRNDVKDAFADGSPIEWVDMNCGGRAWAVWEEE